MTVRDLLDGNARWAAGVDAADPTFFNRLSHQQTPEYLWIGCSDSRVQAAQLVALEPGEIFVHRNVANLAVASDLNMLAVLQYGVEILQVRDVVVCGHYGCGGVRAALRGISLGLIDNWLAPLRSLAEAHRDALAALPGETAKVDRLCELNVAAQVANVAATPIVQAAWRRGQSLSVHGLIYRLVDGRLRDLDLTLDGPDALPAEQVLTTAES